MLTDQGLPVVIGSCTMCGWDDTYTTGGLCMDCASIREWSRGNRAFCQLIHGEWPGRVVEDITDVKGGGRRGEEGEEADAGEEGVLRRHPSSRGLRKSHD